MPVSIARRRIHLRSAGAAGWDMIRRWRAQARRNVRVAWTSVARISPEERPGFSLVSTERLPRNDPRVRKRQNAPPRVHGTRPRSLAQENNAEYPEEAIRISPPRAAASTARG